MSPIPHDRFDDAEELLGAILPEKSKGLSTFSLRFGPKDVVSELPASKKPRKSAHEPVRVDLETATREPDGPRDRVSELSGGAKVGARNGAIWGICTLLPSGLLLATFIQLVVVLETVDAASPSVGILAWLGTVLSGIALGGLIGGTLGGTIGAMWGLLTVIVCGPGSIDPVNFSDVGRSIGRLIKQSLKPKAAELGATTSPERVVSRPAAPSAHSARTAEAVSSPSGFEVGPSSKTGTAVDKSKTSGGWATWIAGVVISGIIRAYFLPTHHQLPSYQRMPTSSYETSKFGRWKGSSSLAHSRDPARLHQLTASVSNDKGLACCIKQEYEHEISYFNQA